jgi:hypothetical protein
LISPLKRALHSNVFIGREGGGGGKKYQLKPLEFLLGTNNRQDDVIVLGMLTQVTID